MIKGCEIILLASALLLATGCSYPELVERGERAPTSERCGECHIAIYNEWKESPHARSFSNPEFREATYDYRFDFCLGCHAPESVYTLPILGGRAASTRPVLRQAKREEGVNCNGCHLTEDCKLAGPLEARAPHPISEAHGLYKRSVLCGTCHEGTFKEWQAISKEDKKSCQECHMPSVQKKLIQDAPWRWLFHNKATKRHTFSSEDGLKALKEPINIKLEELQMAGLDAAGVVELENLSVLHSIPTGDYGYREVVLSIEIEDSSGKKNLLKEESFFKEMDTALNYGEKRSIEFSLPSDSNREGFRLIITLLRRSFDDASRVVLAQKSVLIKQLQRGRGSL
ncbi:MAG: multiheme c-type cytochrome [Candidatus Brocadiales bacterium]